MKKLTEEQKQEFLNIVNSRLEVERMHEYYRNNKHKLPENISCINLDKDVRFETFIGTLFAKMIEHINELKEQTISKR